MADSSLMPALIGLGGTFIGAVIGFGGTLLSQRSLSRLNKEADERKQEAEKKKRKAEKLEEFLSALWEQNALFSRHYERQEAVKLIAPTLAKLDALTIIYFPHLRPHLGSITRSGSNYLLTLAGAIEGVDIETAKTDYQNSITSLGIELLEYCKRELNKQEISSYG